MAAAALGDDRTREIATALAGTAEAAVRVAVLDALAAAADALSVTLADETGGRVDAVELRLAGDDVQFAVTSAREEHLEHLPEPVAVDDGETTARISFRLTETLKTEIERAARTAEISVNTWLIRSATTALSDTDRRPQRKQHRMTGWVTG